MVVEDVPERERCDRGCSLEPFIVHGDGVGQPGLPQRAPARQRVQRALVPSPPRAAFPGRRHHRSSRPQKPGTTWPALLSFHYLHAQRSQEAWSYSLQAAEQARVVYANPEAAEYFERLIAAGRRLMGTLRPRGKWRRRTKGWATHGTDRKLPGGGQRLPGGPAARREDVVGQARLLLKLARVEGWLDRFTTHCGGSPVA